MFNRRLTLLTLSRSFLDDIYRIANLDYIPSDDDIIRARLRTMGVQEYSFMFEGKGALMYCRIHACD